MKSKLFDFTSLAIAIALACLVYWLVLPHGVPLAGALAIGVLATVLWITEVLPLAVTAILIPVGYSSVGVLDVSNAFSAFGSPIIFLVLGGYAMAAAVRENRIDHWLAHVILVRSGTVTKHVVLSLMATSAFLSMLISNTATTALLLPVAAGILSRQKSDPNLARLLMLCIAYGASIGGTATLVGSPPNAIAAGLLDIDFLQWLGYGLPVCLVMLVIAIHILWWKFPPTHAKIDLDLSEKAPLLPAGKRAIGVLGMVFFLWLVGPQMAQFIGLPSVLLSATSVACLAVAVLMLTRCLSWDEFQNDVQWGVLLLLGGGLTLGRGLTESGAANWLSQSLVFYIGDLPLIGVLFVLLIIAVFVTELISNTAVTATLSPVLIGVSIQLGLNAESLVVPVAIATSMAFMLPVATPPNAMVHASGFVSQKDMMRVGLWLNLSAVVVIAVVFYGLSG